MAHIVGLDIGTRTIAGAVFTGSAKRFRLTDFFVEEIPTLEGAAAEAAQGAELVAPPSLAETIQNALAARGLQGADIIASVDAKDAIIREISVPFTRDEHIKKTIISEAENHFQTFDIEDVVLEYFKVEEMGDKSRVLIAAVKNSVISERLETLKQAGVDPLALDLDAAALYNAFALTPTFDPGRSTLIIDMGATSTKIILVEKGQLKRIRSIRMDSFLHGSRARLLSEPPPERAEAKASASVPFPEAYSIEARFEEIENALRRLEPMGGEEVGGLRPEEEPIAILTDEEFDLVHRGGTAGATTAPPAAAPAAARERGATATEPRAAPGNGSSVPPASSTGRDFEYSDYLDRLGTEIQRTFASASPGAGVELICLTGGMSHREEARRYFREEFDVETIDLDFADSFPMDLSREAQAGLGRLGGVAVGLAQKELGGDRIGFDFRKKEFRFERKFEKVQYPVLVLAALLFLVFLQSTFNLYHRHGALSDQIADIRAREQKGFEAFFGKPNSSDLLKIQAESEKKNWERILGVGGANIPAFIPIVDALQEVTRALRESGANQSRIESIELRLKTSIKNQRIAPESSSTLTISTSDADLGSRVKSAFDKPQAIFSASPSESRQGGNIRLVLTLTPQDRYLETLKR